MSRAHCPVPALGGSVNRSGIGLPLTREMVKRWLWRMSLVRVRRGRQGVEVSLLFPYWRLEPYGTWIGFN